MREKMEELVAGWRKDAEDIEMMRVVSVLAAFVYRDCANQLEAVLRAEEESP